jgi:hypothetical protein
MAQDMVLSAEDMVEDTVLIPLNFIIQMYLPIIYSLT